MKLKLVSVLALGGLLTAAFACGDSTGDGGSGGEGGSGGDATTSSKSSSASKSTSTSTSVSTSTSTSSGSAGGSCDEIGACEGDGTTPDSGCVECAVLGDATTATDGGACAADFQECFGDGSDACTGAGEPDCCELYDCIDACDTNMNGTFEPGAELDCFCTNDGAQCVQQQMPGSCIGDHPNGFTAALAWETCLFDDVCPDSCGQ